MLGRINNMKLRYKIGVGVASTAAVVGLGGAAFAYFTGTGNDTGSAAVGASGNWTVTHGDAVGSAYPGQGSSVITFTITNAGNGNQAIEAGKISTAVVNDGGTPANIEQNTVAVAGCRSGWFTDTLGTPSVAYGTSVAPGDSETVTATITMSDTGNQNACQSKSPDVSLSVAAS
jgi:hypothetical protein